MNSVTVSPKFQIVIPKEIHDHLHILPGNKLQVFSYNNRIEIVPIKPFKELKGILKGMNTENIREQDRV